MKAMVLLYHRVYPGYHIDPETFEYQMKTISEKFIPLSLDDLVALIRGNMDAKRPGVAITFDDGWADNFVYAFPILKKYKLHGTIFASTRFILDRPVVRPTLDDYWHGKIEHRNLFQGIDMNQAIYQFWQQGSSDQFLSWEEMNLMQKKGVIDIQSHGHSHASHFSSSRIVDYLDNNSQYFPNTWLLLSGTFDLNPGAPIYKSGSVLAYPRHIDDQNLRHHISSFVRSNGGSHFFTKRNWKKVLNKRVIHWQKLREIKSRFETVKEWKKRAKSDLEQSIYLVETNLGTKSEHLAWPFGEYNSDSIELAKALGFRSCYTTNFGKINGKCNPYEIPRVGPPRNRMFFKLLMSETLNLKVYLWCLKVYRLLRNIFP